MIEEEIVLEEEEGILTTPTAVATTTYGMESDSQPYFQLKSAKLAHWSTVAQRWNRVLQHVFRYQALPAIPWPQFMPVEDSACEGQNML